MRNSVGAYALTAVVSNPVAEAGALIVGAAGAVAAASVGAGGVGEATKRSEGEHQTYKFHVDCCRGFFEVSVESDKSATRSV